MVGDGLPGERRPVHARDGLGREATARRVGREHDLGPPSEMVAKIIAADRAAWLRRRLALTFVVVVLVAAVAGGAVQWLRPLPQPALEGVAATTRIPGTAPSLPWPSTGEAALSVPGLGTLVQPGGTKPVPVGVLAGMLTAYVVLKDHPLPTGGSTGPAIPVTAQALAAYQSGNASGVPEVPVSAGESVTELAALEGLLVGSGNDMATLLADWDAGSTSAFVTKMDRSAASLGLRDTRVTAPGGADDAVTSTPADLIRLAEAAMRIPVLSQIVSLGQVTVPQAGLVYNPNYLLGTDGVVGIDAGADTTTDGCFLFAAQKTVGGRTVTLYGAVLGQAGPIGPTAAAVGAGDALVKAALPALTAVPIVQAGHTVGHLVVPWGASAPVTASKGLTVDAWSGSSISVTQRLVRLTAPVAAGTRVGWLQVREGSRVLEAPLHTTARLEGPSRLWRLTR